MRLGKKVIQAGGPPSQMYFLSYMLHGVQSEPDLGSGPASTLCWLWPGVPFTSEPLALSGAGQGPLLLLS